MVPDDILSLIFQFHCSHPWQCQHRRAKFNIARGQLEASLRFPKPELNGICYFLPGSKPDSHMWVWCEYTQEMAHYFYYMVLQFMRACAVLEEKK